MEEKPKKETKKNIVVVPQLPTQQVKEGEIDGIKTEFITIDEAMTEMLIKIREIHKNLG